MSRRDSARAHRYPASARPAHQMMAVRVVPPDGVPFSSPRSESMTGVNGSCAANHRTAPDIWPGGTNALLMNGSSWTTRVKPAVPPVCRRDHQDPGHDIVDVGAV